LIGNLIDLAEQGHFNVIVHGCNCFHTMGAGIAKEIKQRYPDAYKADITRTIKGDKGKLGAFTWADVQAPSGHPFRIVNAYIQYRYGKGGPHINYTAVKQCFQIIQREYWDKRIGYPKIGAGLAGGDWNIIQTIINEELKGFTHQLVTFK